MNKTIIALFALTLISPTVFADNCDDLGHAGVHFQVAAGTYSATAGSQLQVPVTILIDHPELLANLDHVDLQFTGGLAAPDGAATMDQDVILRDGGVNQNLPTVLTFATTAAMGGEYSLSAFLATDGCGYPSQNPPGVALHVDNSPDKIELNAPVVTAVQMQKSYDINKPMTFTADVKDQSAICTVGTADCQSSVDLWFGGEEEGFIIAVAQVTATPKPGRYAFTFQNAFWEKGTYPIQEIWVQDQWRNHAEDLPQSLQMNLVVTGTAHAKH